MCVGDMRISSSVTQPVQFDMRISSIFQCLYHTAVSVELNSPCPQVKVTVAMDLHNFVFLPIPCSPKAFLNSRQEISVMPIRAYSATAVQEPVFIKVGKVLQ